MARKYFRKVVDRTSYLTVTVPAQIAGELGIKAGDLMACAAEGRRIVMEVVDSEPVLEGLSEPDSAVDAIREMMRPDGEEPAPRAGRAGAGRPKESKLERLRLKGPPS